MNCVKHNGDGQVAAMPLLHGDQRLQACIKSAQPAWKNNCSCVKMQSHAEMEHKC